MYKCIHCFESLCIILNYTDYCTRITVMGTLRSKKHSKNKYLSTMLLAISVTN